jgi:ubiquinone/menaquinone biosynthesis C-methylase UbiE
MKNRAAGRRVGKVEAFYSSGLKGKRYVQNLDEQPEDGFLSFGYWEKTTESYLDAAKNLLNFFISNSGVACPGRILNVACGYGTETFAYYHAFKPTSIQGLDITEIHVDCANRKAKKMQLEDKITFARGDACALQYPDNSFSHVMSIEGPSHFNTREKFFKSAHRVLQKGGELLLTDIILGDKFKRDTPGPKIIPKIVGKSWVIPRANWVYQNEYIKLLQNAGLDLVFFKGIGNRVFPGYAANSLKLKTMKSRAKHRGLFPSIGLAFISYMLGWLYKRDLIEYIYVKARKAI